MKIKIEKILERATAEAERLWLKVLSDTDLQYYIVFGTTYTSQNQIYRIQRHAYWFAPKPVTSGDNVFLYSKKGKAKTKENKDGTKTHIIYWGLDQTVWNNEGDCAVVFEVNNWQTSKYE